MKHELRIDSLLFPGTTKNKIRVFIAIAFLECQALKVSIFNNDLYFSMPGELMSN
jgi:hypothetical protein